jgi:hypothetical protein
VFADDGCMDRARIHVKSFAQDVAKTLGVKEGAGTNDLASWQTRLPLGDEGKDVHGIRCNEKNPVEVFGHELLDTTADYSDVARQHVEAGTAKLCRCAHRHDDNRACGCVFVRSGEYSYRRAERNSLLEIQGFPMDAVFGVADENDLASKVVMQNSVGAGGSDMATADDGDACVLRGHGLSFRPDIFGCYEA